jgi:hypothetical protein
LCSDTIEPELGLNIKPVLARINPSLHKNQKDDTTKSKTEPLKTIFSIGKQRK